MKGCYLYCITRGKLEDYQDSGVNDERVYPIYARQLTAVVHDCQAEPYVGDDEQARRWIIEHNQVIERIQKIKGEVIPMSFDVIIKESPGNSAPTNVQSWLDTNQSRFLTKLADLKGKAEYKVTIYLIDSLTEDGYIEDDITQPGKLSGIEYLRRKKEIRDLQIEYSRIINQQIDEYRQLISSTVSAISENKLKRANQKERMILNLSICASSKEAEQLGILLDKINQNSILKVRYAGPWACYSFIKDLFQNIKEQAKHPAP